MPPIHEWLRSIGLDEHSERFVEARITADLLPELSDSDLEKLGLPLGDRKRVLRAIAALADTAPRDGGTAARPPPGGPEPVQLRQITVAFIDLVGSTALAARLDLEDYKDTLRTYHVACTRVVNAHGGFVSQYAGDGVVAYFGYPRAQEDDPEQAVLAGLDALREVARIPVAGWGNLAARVGVATGQVVIDGLVYDGIAKAPAAMGEIPNLAARLQSLAEPGQVLVSATTRRLLGNEFLCDDAGLHALKGFAEKLHVFRVRGVKRSVSRFEAHQRGKWTPFVNRDEERAFLRRRWDQACAGEGNVVLLSGEPGIGKSRLARELAEQALAQTPARLQFQCSAHHTQSALYPVIAHYEHAARIGTDDGADERLRKLRALLEDSPEDARNLKHFARLISAGGDDGEARPGAPGGPGAASRHRRDAMMQAVIDRMLRHSRAAPLLVIFEDLHWIDPTSQEFLDLFVERLAGESMLLLCTFRQEYAPPWTGLAHVTRLDVNRLKTKEAAAIVTSIAAGRGQPVAALDAIVAKTDGVPLFIEELTKAALEASTETGNGRRPVDPLALPSTLKDSLMSRLDRLPLAEKVMPVGAAIGRQFSHRVLAAVTGLDDTVLIPALTQLVDAELLFQRGTPPDSVYTFKHALVQDVAYESMLKSRMRDLHARIAATIEETFPQVIENRPEVAARHFTRARQHKRALHYWEMAAQKAIARSANAEAVSHIEAALDELEHEADPAARQRHEIRLREMLCVPLEARSWGSDDIASNLNRLHDLVAGQGDAARLFTILHGLCGTNLIAGDAQSAARYAGRMMEIARDSDEDALRVLANRSRGMTSFFLGRFAEAIASFEETVRTRPNVAEPVLQKYYVADPEIVARCMIVWARALSDEGDGPADDTRAALDDAVRRARSNRHDFTRAYALSILASACQTLGDAGMALELGSEAYRLSETEAIPYWQAWSQIVSGWATAMTGDPARGIGMLKLGLERYQRTGSRQIVPYAKALLSEACLATGRVTEGVAALEEIEELRASHSIRFYDRRIAALATRLSRAPGGNGATIGS